MSLLNLSRKSLRNRFSSLLITIVAIALSISLLLLIERARVDTKASFYNTVSGTDLIVGARTGSTELLLFSVFRIGHPTNNLSWQSYQKIAGERSVKWSVPLSLGDSHKGYTVIGTNNDYFKHYQFANKQSLVFAKGHQFEQVQQVVLGANVADKLHYHLGDTLTLSHGAGNTSFHNHDDHPFTVVGILAPTGTAVDNSLHVPLAAIDTIHGTGNHSNEHNHDEHSHDEHSHDEHSHDEHNHDAHDQNSHDQNSHDEHNHDEHSHDEHSHDQNNHDEHNHDEHIHDAHDQNSHDEHNHDEHNHDEHSHDEHNHDKHSHDKHNHDEHSHDEHSHDEHSHDAHDQNNHDEHNHDTHDQNNHDEHSHDEHSHDEHNHDEHSHDAHDHQKHDDLQANAEQAKPVSEQALTGKPTQISAFLLGLENPIFALQLQRNINQYQDEPLLAIMPKFTLRQLWEVVGIFEKALLVISGAVVIIALLGMLTNILASLSQRRRELAILRSVGASPRTIFILLGLESLLITVTATVLAIAFYYLIIAGLANILGSISGIHLQMAMLSQYQLSLLAGIIALGTFFGCLPAYKAYRYALSDGLTIKV